MLLRLAAVTAIALATIQTRASDEPLTVSAAISLTDALQEIGSAYETAGRGRLRFNFAASNVLARQIVNGAPVDLFISADESQMDLAAQSGALRPNTRVALLGNQLAIVATPERAPSIPTVQALADTQIRRIAIGDPAAVPAGVYARRYLERVGLWERLGPRLVPASSVRAALAAVENGSVDAGIVYVTDVAAAKNVRLVFVVPVDQAPRIVYPAAVVNTGRNADGGARLLEYLRGADATAVFVRYGFLPLAARR